MTEPDIDWPDFKSQLTYYPEYAQAIGMVAIEVTSMEVMLGDLLGTLLDLPDAVSHNIYFTPKAAIARLDTLVNVVSTPMFEKHETIQNAVIGIAKRAKAVMGKRHDVIHAHWVTSPGGEMIGRLRPPFESNTDYEHVDLKVLNTLIDDVQQVTRDARHLIDKVCWSLRPGTWHHVCAQLDRVAAELKKDNLRLQALYEAR